jgi:hypothetical protein
MNIELISFTDLLPPVAQRPVDLAGEARPAPGTAPVVEPQREARPGGAGCSRSSLFSPLPIASGRRRCGEGRAELRELAPPEARGAQQRPGPAPGYRPCL